MTDAEILECLELAFRPHRCVAGVWDYGAKLRFRIFDGDDVLLKTVANVNLDSVRSEADLKNLCEAVLHSL